MTSQAKVAIVTGANKGIGYAIVRNLALSYVSLHRPEPLVIYLGSRNPNLGESSVSQLQKEFEGRQVLTSDNGNVEIKFLKIDLTNKDTINEAAERVKNEYGGKWIKENLGKGVDILINNAGMAYRGSAFDTNVVKTTLATNFYGTLDVINKFTPLLRPNARIVNVSSLAGQLRILSPELAQKFSDPNLDVDGLIKLLQQFQYAVDHGTWTQEGWPTQAYGVSKIGVTGLSRILARRFASEGKNILVNACCPGWVRTDMTNPNAPLSPDQGAETPVFLALDEKIVPSSPNGELWSLLKIHKW
ncbi:hypothetical protein G9A89_015305 [Geosiphon pyriformis]|nr:hypothetical protein G9A89_015305 [Geosiphon pyriformis]